MDLVARDGRYRLTVRPPNVNVRGSIYDAIVLITKYRLCRLIEQLTRNDKLNLLVFKKNRSNEYG